MRYIFALIFVLSIPFTTHATIHTVDVGGSGLNPNNLPFYAPQFLTVQIGDTVLWNWTEGQHNVTSNTAPVAFASGNLNAPATFQFVFTVAGIYGYDCTLFNHAATQFGTITVEEGPLAVASVLKEFVQVYPVPMKELLNLKFPVVQEAIELRISDVASGKMMINLFVSGAQATIPVGNLPKGVYLIEILTAEERVLLKVIK